MPRPPRFYAPEEFSSGEVISLSLEDTHHARNVLRLRVGAAVELFNGAGSIAAAVLNEAGGAVASVTISDVAEIPPPSPAMTVATAIPKGKRWRWLLEKCTELGAATIQPIHFAHSTAKREGTPEKWQRWAIEASKQCRRAWLPQTPAPLPLESFLAAHNSGTILLACPDGTPAQEIMPGWQTVKRGDSAADTDKIVCVIIGPEAGIRPAEAELCLAVGAQRICFARDILRIETAALAACAIVGSP